MECNSQSIMKPVENWSELWRLALLIRSVAAEAGNMQLVTSMTFRKQAIG